MYEGIEQVVFLYIRALKTSYVMVPLDVEGCRRVAVETEPFADNMHTALGPCCANAKSFEPISCTFEDKDSETV